MAMCDARHGSDLEQVRTLLGKLCAHRPNSPEMLWELLSSCSKDVTLDTRYALPDGRLYSGRRGVEDFFNEWLSNWRKWEWTAVDLFATPNGVCVLVEERAESRYRIRVKQRHIQNWELQEGKILRWTMFTPGDDPLAHQRIQEEIAA